MTAELWATLNAKMMTYLQSITLETLVSEQRARGVEVERKPAPPRHLQAAPSPKPVRPTTPNSVFALGGLLLSGR
jgi:Rrf2 family iron-sulfur cluster assembly transcriptional regulator